MEHFAYLDPGTGTIIVQAVLGGVAGVAVLFKTMGGKFRRKSRSEQAETVTDSDESDEQAKPTVPGD